MTYSAQHHAVNPGYYRSSQRRYRTGNRETVNAAARASHKKERRDPQRWARQAVCAARARAKKRGLPFSITIANIVVPALCPVLGIPIVCCGPNRDNSPSLDQFEHAQGYTPDNVRVISWRANALKRDASVAEIELLLSYMRGRK